ncbi:hypothetical protein Taro_005896 [Colocasia esculenta]|uniref:Aminotransferase-like plant mobile domain-containing protein n=1 Tax=Colocasia esculenta TaxID=4460 RepID=A0A843TW00_COLES|nr:hypothetical protein [Colocasia esculenta]
MVPTLEDVVWITGLRVDGQAVTGTTYRSYKEPVERLLDLEVRGERSSLVGRTALQASLGVANARHRTGEGQAEYLARLTEDARVVLAEEEGEVADRDLRRFLILVIGKLILGTRGDPVGCRCLPLLEDLSSVGNYAWGAALLAHLFDSLGTSSREIGIAGFFPLLQVWVYYRLPSLGRGVARRRGAVQDIWLHCFNTVVPLHHRLVARTLGLHQAVVEFPTRQRAWERPGRSFRGIQQVTDWTVRVRELLDDWERRGKEVVSEATSDEDYYRAYARRYGAQVYRGTRRPGVLHSTIQQRNDLQVVVDQLRAELDRTQQMVGGASSSREDPGRSVLEGQLASAAARAEDALAQLREWEQELRTALAWTTTLEAEMAELRLRPEAAEVARWRQEAEAAAHWQEEATEATRWRQEAEEAARMRAEAGDLCTQLGEERHRSDMLRSKMRGLERALALVGRSRSVTSRSGIPSGSAGHYLTGSSGRRRNEEEERRRRERVPERSETGPRVMAPLSPRPPEGPPTPGSSRCTGVGPPASADLASADLTSMLSPRHSNFSSREVCFEPSILLPPFCQFSPLFLHPNLALMKASRRAGKYLDDLHMLLLQMRESSPTMRRHPGELYVHRIAALDGMVKNEAPPLELAAVIDHVEAAGFPMNN